MSHNLRTEIEIPAPPAPVWAVLTDLERWAEWNPFATATGRPQVGEKLIVRLTGARGGKGMTFKPRVTAAEPGQRFAWLGRLGVPGLFDGEHSFTLEPLDDGTRTRLVHAESFTGVLVGLFARMLDGNTGAGFDQMNAALADRVAAVTGGAG